MRYAFKTDAAAEGIVAGLAVRLGRTDADGRLVVQDSTRFPALSDVPRRFEAVDEIGSVLGSFEVGRSFGLVLQGARGRTSSSRATLVEGGTVLEATFAP